MLDDDQVPDGEIHAAIIATVDPAARRCTVVFPALDGGDERSRPIPYDPRLIEADEGLELEHPTRGAPAVVLEDNRGGQWVAQWTPHG